MADKQTYGLLGRNIGYSLSPLMHNAAFRHFDIPAVYELFDIEETDLESFFNNRILSGAISGCNVTVPYKVKIRKMLEACPGPKIDLQDIVKITGALNTVKIKTEKIVGFNTDVEGFWRALVENTGINTLSKKTFFIAGAGGAGRAISLYLATINAAERIYVYDIDTEMLNSLGEAFKINGCISSDIFYPVSKAENVPKKIEGSDVIINATPIGTKEGDDRSPVPFESLDLGMVIYDLVYARETRLINFAKENGIVYSDGLDMLINQGALAFEIWTGKRFENIKKVMRKELLKQLGR